MLSSVYAAPSGPPLNIRVVPVSESVINITWDPPLLFERNGIITGYQINVTRVENNERRVHMVSVSDSITLSMEIRGTKLINSHLNMS